MNPDKGASYGKPVEPILTQPKAIIITIRCDFTSLDLETAIMDAHDALTWLEQQAYAYTVILSEV